VQADITAKVLKLFPSLAFVDDALIPETAVICFLKQAETASTESRGIYVDKAFAWMSTHRATQAVDVVDADLAHRQVSTRNGSHVS